MTCCSGGCIRAFATLESSSSTRKPTRVYPFCLITVRILPKRCLQAPGLNRARVKSGSGPVEYRGRKLREKAMKELREEHVLRRHHLPTVM